MATPLQLEYLFADPPNSADAPARVYDDRDGGREIPGRGAPADPNELEFVRRMAAGDESALRELHEKLSPRLWDFADALTGTADVADELVQEAFVLLWERASTWDAASHVRGFLYLTVRNQARNRTRHQRIATRAESRSGEDVVSGSMGVRPLPPDVIAEQQELVRMALAAIAELPEPRRTALVLRWREQLPYEEIGRVLGISVAMARQHVTRARETLRSRIGHLFPG